MNIKGNMASKNLIEKEPTENVRYYHSHNSDQYIFHHLNETGKMHGVKRVIIFCFMIVILPTTLIIIPLYLRNAVFSDMVFQVAESDIIEIREGMSSIFCQKHTLRMDTSFNAFQLSSKPEISSNHKHIRLKKSMTLPDDTLEYWGFYLLKGATVKVKFCSSYKGSKILVVKGDRNLDTCGLLDHNKNKVGANFAQGHEKVSITFEDKEEFTMNHTLYNNTENDVNNIGFHGNNNHIVDESENHAEEDDEEREDDEKILDHPERISNHSGAQIKNQLEGTINVNKFNSPSINATRRNFRHRRHHQSKKVNANELQSQDEIDIQKRILEHERRKKEMYDKLFSKQNHQRSKRSQVYDRKVNHGGNAMNFTEDESNSISSFENGLMECYSGKLLLKQGFSPQKMCSLRYLSENSKHVSSLHEVAEDGYYYYIFYSDNDLIKNDIHAIFDIYKPTFQYANATYDDSHVCINSTNCTFTINSIFSNEYVIVEVPTRDGIEHEEDDVTLLTSQCHPRMSVYVVFPICVLILILSCSFL